MSQPLDLSDIHEWPELYDVVEARHRSNEARQNAKRPGDEAGALVRAEESRPERDS